MGLLDALTSGLGHTTQSDNTALHQKLHEEYLKLQAQKAMQAQQSSYLTSATSTNPYLYQSQATFTNPVPTVNLEEGAWDVPVSQLVDLWTVRFGSRWVPEEELDEFYSIAATRLSALSKLERHNVNMKIVNRIVE